MELAVRSIKQSYSDNSNDIWINLKIFERISSESGRVRSIIACDDIYDLYENLVFNKNDIITFEKWDVMKDRLDSSKKYNYKINEEGIIVLVDLRPNSANFSERFNKNSHIIALLMEDKDVDVSEKDERIYTVYNPNDLLKTYMATNSRLIIVVNEPDNLYKLALARVKKYDPYARFMLASNLLLNDREVFMRHVYNNYYRNSWAKTLKEA